MLYFVRPIRGLFVLHPHLSRLEPDSVVSVRATAHDHRQVPRRAACAAADLKCPAAFPTQPALRSGDEQVQSKLPLVRKYDVVVAVVIDVNETQAVVTALRINDGAFRWQSIGQSFPGMLFFRPGESRVLRFIGDHQFASAIVVQIAQAHAAIAHSARQIARRGEDRFPIDFQSVEQCGFFNPLRAVEAPRPGDGLVADECGDTAIGVNDPELDAVLLPVPLLVRLHQRHGKAARDPLLFVPPRAA